MRIKLLIFLMGVLVVSLIGCGPSDISGTYQNAQTSETLRLTKERKLIRVATGDTADYSLEGTKLL